MTGITGLKMIFTMWLALLACVSTGDIGSMSTMESSMKTSSSLSRQSSPFLDISTLPGINNVYSMSIITIVSSTGCSKQTAPGIMLARPSRHLEGDQLVSSIELASGHCSLQISTPISSPTLLADGKPVPRAVEVPSTSISPDAKSSKPAKSAKGVLAGATQKARSVTAEPSQTTVTPARPADTTASIESQFPSSPTLTPESTVAVSLAATTSLSSTTPSAEPATPAHSPNSAVVIGAVVGSTCGLLLLVAGAAICCISRLRQKIRFHRGRDDPPRCGSAATTLTAGSAGISNASSLTVFEAHEALAAQIPARAGGGRDTMPRGRRARYEGYEMDGFHPGYSAGGFLSAV